MDKEYVTVCPKCGSTKIKIDSSPIYAVTGLINQYKQCSNCGYHGQFFPEEQRAHVRKKPLKPGKIPKRNLVDTSFGQAYFKYIIYIGIPVSVLAIMFMYLMLGSFL